LLFPLSLLLGEGLLSLGGVGLLLFPLGGGMLLVGGGVDCVGQFALASITDPSGHVLVVGDAVDGVKVWGHDGSVGFFVQSIGGGVPDVQLPAEHVDPDPFPLDGIVGIDALVGCIGADVLPSGLNVIPDMLVEFVRFVDVVLVALVGIVAFAGITVKVADLEVDL
jgi:hypothetical protein